MAFPQASSIVSTPAGTRVRTLGPSDTTRQRWLDKVTVTSWAAQPSRTLSLGSGAHALARTLLWLSLTISMLSFWHSSGVQHLKRGNHSALIIKMNFARLLRLPSTASEGKKPQATWRGHEERLPQGHHLGQKSSLEITWFSPPHKAGAGSKVEPKLPPHLDKACTLKLFSFPYWIHSQTWEGWNPPLLPAQLMHYFLLTTD